jgi:hypothetical protein
MSQGFDVTAGFAEKPTACRLHCVRCICMLLLLLLLQVNVQLLAYSQLGDEFRDIVQEYAAVKVSAPETSRQGQLSKQCAKKFAHATLSSRGLPHISQRPSVLSDLP